MAMRSGCLMAVVVLIVQLKAVAAARVAPDCVYGGRHFTGASWDYEKLNGLCEGTFGGAFSVAFTAVWEELADFSRVFDFGLGSPDRNLLVTLVPDGKMALGHFSPNLDGLVTWSGLSEPHRYLFALSPSGHVRAWRDGSLDFEGEMTPLPVATRELLVAKSHFPGEPPFKGTIEDLWIWHSEVDWESATTTTTTTLTATRTSVTTAATTAFLASPEWRSLAMAIGAVACAFWHARSAKAAAAEMEALMASREQDRARINRLESQAAERYARSQEEEARINSLQCRLIAMDEELNARMGRLQGLLSERDEELARLSVALRHEQEKQDQRIARLEAETEGKQGCGFDMQAFMHASLQQQMLGLHAHMTQLFQEQGRRQPGNGQPGGEQPDVPAAAGCAPTESAGTPEERRTESQLLQLASVEIERLSKKLQRRTQQLSQLTQASGARLSAGQALDSSSCNSCGSSVGSFAMTYSHEQGSPFADVRAGPASAATEDFSMVEDAQTRVTVLSEEAQKGEACELQSCLVLTFNKYPMKLTEAVLASEVAQRLQAEGLDLEPAWANGAKIFVKGLTQEIMEQSDYPERLRNCDVVLQEADEEGVLASLSALQYRVRPRLKRRTALSSSCPTDEGQSSACQPGPELVVERTFVDFRLPKAITPRSLYTLSSNDKDGSFPNPRKWAPAARAP